MTSLVHASSALSARFRTCWACREAQTASPVLTVKWPAALDRRAASYARKGHSRTRLQEQRARCVPRGGSATTLASLTASTVLLANWRRHREQRSVTIALLDSTLT